jgi:hypothetical protein
MKEAIATVDLTSLGESRNKEWICFGSWPKFKIHSKILFALAFWERKRDRQGAPLGFPTSLLVDVRHKLGERRVYATIGERT